MSFALQKLGGLILSLWVIATLTFLLMKVLPGDPFSNERALPGPIHQSLREYYGLDEPILKQYVRYLSSLIQGDLGPSFKYQDLSVNGLIARGSKVTLTLGLEAFFLSLMIGIPLGVMAAFWQGRWQEQLLLVFLSLCISIPSFLLAALLQWILGVKYNILPIARWGTFAHTILPTLALATLPTAFIARILRANLMEVMKQDYILLAYAKGLPRWRVFFFHAFKNAILPLLPFLGQLAAGILTGSFIVEKIFAIPGVGTSFVTSVINRDYTVIMGLTLFFCVVLLSCITLSELLFHAIDPRKSEGYAWKKIR